MSHTLICRFCGRDNRLSRAEKNKLVSDGLRKSKKKLGAPRRIDQDKVIKLLSRGKSLNETARLIGTSKTRICQIKRALKLKANRDGEK